MHAVGDRSAECGERGGEIYLAGPIQIVWMLVNSFIP